MDSANDLNIEILVTFEVKRFSLIDQELFDLCLIKILKVLGYPHLNNLYIAVCAVLILEMLSKWRRCALNGVF